MKKLRHKVSSAQTWFSQLGNWLCICAYTSACRYAGPGPRPRAAGGSAEFSFWFLAGEKPSASPRGLYVIWGVEEQVNEWVCFLS